MDNLLRLLNIVEILRDPEKGCPWDVQQTFSSIAPHTIEEVYEVVDAIDRKDFTHLKDELGDLLLQIAYYTQIAREENLFSFDDVAKGISDKLIRRHPHVFDNQSATSADSWEKIKQKERQNIQSTDFNSLLKDIPKALPELIRAKKIQKRAALVGFDWDNVDQVFKKVDEELDELKNVKVSKSNKEILEEELGDLLFSVVNLSRHLKLNAEESLRKSNLKFVRRFEFMENKILEAGKEFDDYSLDELEELWAQAKSSEN